MQIRICNTHLSTVICLSCRFLMTPKSVNSASVSFSFLASKKKRNLSFPCFWSMWALMRKVLRSALMSTLNAECTRIGRTGKTTIASPCLSMPTRKEDSSVAVETVPTSSTRNENLIFNMDPHRRVIHPPGFSGRLTTPLL